MWPLIRMRPIDIIANPNDIPKSIFISSFDTNPRSPATKVRILKLFQLALENQFLVIEL